MTYVWFYFPQVRVNVLDKNDSPPSFGDQPILFTVSEELGAGQTVGVVKARDPDTLGRVRYTLREPQGRDKFSLDPDSGTLRLLEPLDRETKDLYKLVIRASDGLQNTDTTITIQVSSWFYLQNIVQSFLSRSAIHQCQIQLNNVCLMTQQSTPMKEGHIKYTYYGLRRTD